MAFIFVARDGYGDYDAEVANVTKEFAASHDAFRQMLIGFIYRNV
jgi:hypothetical protein